VHRAGRAVAIIEQELLPAPAFLLKARRIRTRDMTDSEGGVRGGRNEPATALVCRQNYVVRVCILHVAAVWRQELTERALPVLYRPG
jgi:hypothetical protein